MSILGKGKKVAKFTFVSMPLSFLGINQLKMGNQQITDLWRSISSPVCPECDKGVLIIQRNESPIIDQQQNDSPRHLYPWVCNSCGFSFLEEDETDKVRKDAVLYRNERVKVDLTELEYNERNQIARRHQIHSRVFFIASLLTAIGFIYMLASGAPLLLAMNWFTIAFAVWVFGMKKSYRSWQVKTGHIFIEGAFLFWFKHEQWFI
jgi:uncharacterized membrane protein